MVGVEEIISFPFEPTSHLQDLHTMTKVLKRLTLVHLRQIRTLRCRGLSSYE